MFSFKKLIICFGIFIVCTLLTHIQQCCTASAQDLAFVEQPEDDKRRQNAENRRPIYIPGRCKDNELYFPGDQKDDWVCDCIPGHIFHPATDKCHPAFRQGPCPAGSFLILKNNSVIPECEKNPCLQDGQVSVKGRCYTLGQSPPCPYPQLSFVLGVNSTTLQLTCVRLSVNLENRFTENEVESAIKSIDLNTIPLCPLGCKRYVQGRCPRSF